MIASINRLLRLPFAFRFATQDWHPPGHVSFASSHSGRKPMEEITLDYGPLTLWPDHALQGTDEAALHPTLDAALIGLLIRKGMQPNADGFSAFSDQGRRMRSGLASMLRERGIKRVFLTGLALDLCVAATAEDAAHEGFATVVIEAACRPSKPDAVDATRSRLLRASVQLVHERDLA